MTNRPDSGVADENVEAQRTRLYTADQVQRLGLLKRLVDRGHPIGQLAHLATDELRSLGGGEHAIPMIEAARPA
jgi:DNA-binding transcriptional MerR regulator